MRVAPKEKMLLNLIVGRSVAVMVAAGSGFALAHDGGHDVDSSYWRHHHHHHHYGSGPGGLGTVHGPGSSHNPIIYHPVTVRDHRRPPQVRDHRTPPQVRDHRTPPLVRDHRTPQCTGNGC